MATKAALTETEMHVRLRAKYGEAAGNGVAYAVMGGVRNAAGFNASRIIDAYVMALWPSRGLELIAFEMKSSRSDWQREMKKPEKAEAFCDLADRFYLVVGDPAIIWPGELPETWGLMVPHGKGLRVEVEAPRLREPTGPKECRDLPPQFDRSFLAALLRSAVAVGARTPEEIAAASGINPCGYQFPTHSPAQVGAAVKVVLHGEQQLDNYEQRLGRIREEAARIAAEAGT